jgi:hypothetical protein
MGSLADPQKSVLHVPRGFQWWMAEMARKLTDEVQLKLRFSEALRRRLAREARRRKRSLNTEIVERLNQSLLNQSADLTTSAAKALLASLDPSIVAKLVDIAMEQEIFKYAMSDEPPSEEGSK